MAGPACELFVLLLRLMATAAPADAPAKEEQVEAAAPAADVS